MIKRIFISLIFTASLALGVTALSAPQSVHAQDQNTLSTMCAQSGGNWNGTDCLPRCSTSFLGLPSWYKYLSLDDQCNVNGPTTDVATGSADDPATSRDESVKEQFDWERATGYIAIAIVELLLRIASLVAVGYVIYGGFRFITSQGDPENAKSARQTVINAIIGLVIAIAAASIVAFIGNRLGTPV